jgi:HEAT repeat protein
MFRVIPGLLLFIIAASTGNCGEMLEEELKRFEEAMKPKTFETGVRSGQVVDAVSGKPIEGAVVVCTWDVREFLIESNTRKAAQYETTTDENGRYSIPSQKIITEGISGLEPEHIYIYKNGYVWYRVYDNKPQSFMEYVPGLKLKYQKENNIVKLQPWNEKFSHSEHIGIFDRMWNYVGPKLKEALQEERAAARQEGQGNTPPVKDAYKISEQMTTNKRAFERGQITRDEYIIRLYEGLKAEDIAELRFAAIELNKLGDTNGVEPLIQFLKKNLYRKSFDVALAEIGGITGRKDLGQTNVIVERLEIIKDLEDWWGRNKEHEKVERIADLVANGRNDNVRREALNQLQLEMDKSAVPYLKKLLTEENKSAGISESVLRLLSRAGDKSAIPAIKSKLYHPDVYVRREAALALNALGDKSGVPVMVATLSSQSRNSRSVANAVLREVTGQDFAEKKSLRSLPADREKEVIEKWLEWWGQNREAMKSEEPNDFSGILAGEEAATQLRYATMEEGEKNNLELPIFEDPSKTPKATLERFRASLLKDDVNTALSLMSYPLKEKYEKIFEQIKEHRGDYARGLGKICFSSKLGNTLYYEMITEQDDGYLAFPVHFAPDFDGNWLITEF